MDIRLVFVGICTSHLFRLMSSKFVEILYLDFAVDMWAFAVKLIDLDLMEIHIRNSVDFHAMCDVLA